MIGDPAYLDTANVGSSSRGSIGVTWSGASAVRSDAAPGGWEHTRHTDAVAGLSVSQKSQTQAALLMIPASQEERW